MSVLAKADKSARQEILLEEGWLFQRGEVQGAESLLFDDSSWTPVTIPHDWAIYGPFGSGNDAQSVAISQNGENNATYKTGRTGDRKSTRLNSSH